MTTQTLGMISILALGLGACNDYRDCSMVDASASLALPPDLLGTGLYEDPATELVVADAIPFTPRFPLWSDGSEKRRWLLLPPGTQVDTHRAEVWEFPVGAKAFKEFTRDGVRVETRLVERTASGWIGAAYVWNEAQTEAVVAHSGEKDAVGTSHDVPSAEQCLACHGGRESFILGFSAIQFTPEERDDLYARGVLSDLVPGEPAVSSAAVAGFGVLEANCSHCHNAERSKQPQATECFDPGEAIDFSFPLSLSSIEASPAVKTASDVLGRPGRSKVLRMMEKRSDKKLSWPMPPLGTELVDDAGRVDVLGLIGELQKGTEP